MKKILVISIIFILLLNMFIIPATASLIPIKNPFINTNENKENTDIAPGTYAYNEEVYFVVTAGQCGKDFIDFDITSYMFLRNLYLGIMMKGNVGRIIAQNVPIMVGFLGILPYKLSLDFKRDLTDEASKEYQYTKIYSYDGDDEKFCVLNQKHKTTINYPPQTDQKHFSVFIFFGTSIQSHTIFLHVCISNNVEVEVY